MDFDSQKDLSIICQKGTLGLLHLLINVLCLTLIFNHFLMGLERVLNITLVKHAMKI